MIEEGEKTQHPSWRGAVLMWVQILKVFTSTVERNQEKPQHYDQEMRVTRPHTSPLTDCLLSTILYNMVLDGFQTELQHLN